MFKPTPFKQFQKTPRVIVAEEVYTNGMQYSNDSLEEGFVKNLINFEVTDNGQSLSPRGGYTADTIVNHTSEASLNAILDITTNKVFDSSIYNHAGGTFRILATGRTRVKIDNDDASGVDSFANFILAGYSPKVLENNPNLIVLDKTKALPTGCTYVDNNGIQVTGAEVSSGGLVLLTATLKPGVSYTISRNYTVLVGIDTSGYVGNMAVVSSTSGVNLLDISGDGEISGTFTSPFDGRVTINLYVSGSSNNPDVLIDNIQLKETALYNAVEGKLWNNYNPGLILFLENPHYPGDLSKMFAIQYNPEFSEAKYPVKLAQDFINLVGNTKHGMSLPYFLNNNYWTIFNNELYFFNQISVIENGISTQLFKLKVMQNSDGIYFMDFIPVFPRDVKLYEAYTYGYNMLSNQPYNFNPKVNASNAYVIYGFFPIDDFGNIKLNVKKGDTVKFKLFYDYASNSAPTISMLITEYYTGGPANGTASTATVILGTAFIITRTINYDDLRLVATFSNLSGTPTGTTYFNFTDSKSSTSSIELSQYPLATAQGLTSWMRRMVLWGVKGAPNIVFISDIDSPDYFPYPNNIIITDADVLLCKSFMGMLLIVTTNSMILVSLGTDGLSMTQKTILEGVSFNVITAQSIKTVKNMIFYTTGNCYYMMVPNTKSLIGEMISAPISNQISNLLNSFETEMLGLIDTVYLDYVAKSFSDKYINISEAERPIAKNLINSLKLKDFYNLIDGNIIKNIYTFKIFSLVDTPVLDEATGTISYNTDQEIPLMNINVSLNYDTVLRTWSISMYSAKSSDIYLKPVRDFTFFGCLIQAGVVSDTSCKLVLYKPSSFSTVDEFDFTSTNSYDPDILISTVPNYHYLDTGFRNHDIKFKKRYREVQFGIYNSQQKDLKFYTAFYLDDVEAKGFFKYIPYVPLGTSQTSELFFEKVLQDPLEVLTVANGTTVLAADETDGTNVWTLDASAFPDTSSVKVHFPVSGKGYSPRLKLLSRNSSVFKILNNSWIFHVMNAR